MANELVKASDVNVDELKRLGMMLATSGYFETAQNRDVAVAQMCVKVMAGRELGFGPFASVNGIHVIKGKPAVSANLMAAAVKANPRYDYRVRKMDNDSVAIEFFEIENGKRASLGMSEFTRQDAKAAGTQNMERYGRNMMFARAMSNGVKWFCPDVFDGNLVYVPEELGAEVDGDGNVIDVDYRSVDKATGEVLSTTTPEAPKANGNGDGNGNAPVPGAYDTTPPDLPAAVAAWTKPEDAYIWAVGIGAAEGGVTHAKNIFTKIVKDEFGGKLTKSNAIYVYISFYHECLKRAADAEAAEVEAKDGDNPFDNVPTMAEVEEVAA